MHRARLGNRTARWGSWKTVILVCRNERGHWLRHRAWNLREHHTHLGSTLEQIPRPHPTSWFTGVESCRQRCSWGNTYMTDRKRRRQKYPVPKSAVLSSPSFPPRLAYSHHPLTWPQLPWIPTVWSPASTTLIMSHPMRCWTKSQEHAL